MGTARSRFVPPFTAAPKADIANDDWGFRLGSRNAFLMAAIAQGSNTKDGIEREFLIAFPDAVGKSTFRVFFSDLVRPFGSASVSRDIILNTDLNGIVTLDWGRAVAVKMAIASGLLKELGSIVKNVYPCKNLGAVQALLSRYGL